MKPTYMYVIYIFPVITCPVVPTLLFATHNGTQTPYILGTILLYTCAAGMRLIDGSPDAFTACNTSGLWDDIGPDCQGKVVRQ